MLEYSPAHWTSFFAAALILNLAPGPDIAFIMGHTVNGGKKNGLAAMFGIWTGAMGHVALAALGLSAIVAASATAFSVVKWAGVAYLLWLGLQAFRSGGEALTANKEVKSGNLWPVFRQGVLVDLFNPKVATFFLAFLPQFVVQGAGPMWLQLFVHGALIIVVAAFVEPPIIFLGDRLTVKLRESKKVGLWLERCLGAMLVGLACRLAFIEK
ncbi:Threonine/homoserine/homoserine lactone efflux protein [Desulfatibacillum alkenivorans DSM 16219]|jgi:threonine/homoserine/homoserine lactone efflux protein|uniref:Threonine/homoserine/homoserine lactone efflux protein n=1 Tax=Desulfatibacillum alkenivorans DSM 16219 TaxID=1121393 RepID=A0A1M6IGX5_9BACT|nr:LysE family translocator [Desulfatibacillum alkenivorans]SHJ33669.1 Threonine/homoserine/homoserine lactone efflux protein [Desulfatibacillum alkenivorans DSM 16219]